MKYDPLPTGHVQVLIAGQKVPVALAQGHKGSKVECQTGMQQTRA